MMQIEKWAYLTMKIGATSDGAAGVIMEEKQFYQVWDWKRNEPQSFHLEKVFAEETAARLNSNSAVDWNGLPRYQVMEAND